MTEAAFIKTFLGKLAAKPTVYKSDFEPPADENAQLPTPSRPFELKFSQTSTAHDREEDFDDESAFGILDITVKQMKGGKSFVVQVTANDTVAQLKEKVAAASGIAGDSQRLVFSGKALQDERTIASYGLSAGSVLHLMIKPASTPADKTVAAPPPASKTEGAPEQESASVSPQTPMRSLSERMKDLESQEAVWDEIQSVLRQNGIEEDLSSHIVKRFRSSLQ